MKSQDPAQSAFGNAVQEMRGLFRDNLERMNPQHAAELSKINAAWAAFSRAQEASIRRPKSMGVFSPNDLAQTVKKSSTKGAFARGDGLLQDLADAGNQVIPGDVPDSGTTGRALWAGLLGYASQVDPHLAATAAAISAPYTSVGMKGINKWAQQPGPVRESLRAGAERATPAAGAVTGGSVADFLNPDQVNLQDGLNLGGNQ